MIHVDMSYCPLMVSATVAGDRSRDKYPYTDRDSQNLFADVDDRMSRDAPSHLLSSEYASWFEWRSHLIARKMLVLICLIARIMLVLMWYEEIAYSGRMTFKAFCPSRRLGSGTGHTGLNLLADLPYLDTDGSCRSRFCKERSAFKTPLSVCIRN